MLDVIGVRKVLRRVWKFCKKVQSKKNYGKMLWVIRSQSDFCPCRVVDLRLKIDFSKINFMEAKLYLTRPDKTSREDFTRADSWLMVYLASYH